MITENEVYIYREIYYEHVKPLILKGTKQEIITKLVEPVITKFGWTTEKYQSFAIMDLMQRLARLRNKNFSFVLGKTIVNPNPLLDQLELKCPVRTSQKD